MGILAPPRTHFSDEIMSNKIGLKFFIMKYISIHFCEPVPRTDMHKKHPLQRLQDKLMDFTEQKI